MTSDPRRTSAASDPGAAGPRRADAQVPEAYDGETRAAIAALRGRIDAEQATRVWGDALGLRSTRSWAIAEVAAA